MRRKMDQSISFKNCCRICLTSEEPVKYPSSDTEAALEHLFSIQICNPCDSNPFWICNFCSAKLLDLYQFSIQVYANLEIYASYNHLANINGGATLMTGKLGPVEVKTERMAVDPNKGREEEYEPIEKRSIKEYVNYIKAQKKTSDIEKKLDVRLESKDYIVREPTAEFTKIWDKIYTEYRRKKLADNSYQCDICEMFFELKKDLRKHIHTTHLYRPEASDSKVCEVCGINVTNNSDLNKHMFTHSDTRLRQQCPKCGKFFLMLATHLKSCEIDDDGTFKCSQCTKAFKTRNKLRRHKYKYHIPVDKRTCDVCKKVFIKKESLKEHMHATHNVGDPLYKCNWCDFRNNYKGNMHLHERKYHPFEKQAKTEQYYARHNLSKLSDRRRSAKN